MMMMLLADTSSTLVQLVLGGFGVTGLIGAVVAIIKIRPDVDSAAVVQAQGAIEGMKELYDSTAEDRDYWRRRSEQNERELQKRTQQFDDEQRRLQEMLATERAHFQQILSGMKLWDEQHHIPPAPETSPD